jgi:hypothetical protein
VSVGPFEVDNAVAPADFVPERDLCPVVAGVGALPAVETVEVPADIVRGIRHGQKVAASDIPAVGYTAANDLLLTHGGAALAVVTISASGMLDYRVVFSEDGKRR